VVQGIVSISAPGGAWLGVDVKANGVDMEPTDSLGDATILQTGCQGLCSLSEPGGSTISVTATLMTK
jgi:hypothetical protein